MGLVCLIAPVTEMKVTAPAEMRINVLKTDLLRDYSKGYYGGERQWGSSQEQSYPLSKFESKYLYGDKES